jgi:hypothetical protein
LFSNTFTSSGLFKCSNDDICCYYYYDPSGNLTPLSVNNAPVDCPTTNPMVTPDSLVVEGLGLTNQMPASAVTVTSASSCYNVLCYDNTLPLVGIKSARAEFPNKTEIIAINKDKFRISYKGTPISSHLVDIQGKLIKENLDNYLDLSQSPNGMYILNIRYANSSESIKFVK